MKISIISLRKAVLQHCMNSPFASELLTRGRILIITTNSIWIRVNNIIMHKITSKQNSVASDVYHLRSWWTAELYGIGKKVFFVWEKL